MNKVIEALRLKTTTALSERRIGRVTGLSPNTVHRYWVIFRERHYSLAEIEQLSDAELDAKFNRIQQRLTRKRMPDWLYIREQMQLPHETLENQWVKYREADYRDAYSYSQFTELYRHFAVKLDLVMRQTHRAGECVFVDFAGSTIPWTDLSTGLDHKAQVFVAVMGCSNYTFVRAAEAQSIPCWVDLHNCLFLFLGGVPELVTPDNLKSAVDKPGRDLIVNRIYAELAKHYGTVIFPARPRKPKDKGKVEAGVRFVGRWILTALAGRRFFSLDEINTAIVELLPRLNEKSFRKLPGSRKTWFEELDKPALKPLPAEPFEYAEWTATQKVPRDYHIRIGDHYYSVPCALVHSHVEARITAKTVEFYQGGRRVASHILSRVIGGSTTLPEHQPPEHRHYAEQTPERFVRWAEDIGKAALTVVRHQFEDHPHGRLGLRACAQLRRLARDYGVGRFESACRRAQSIDSLTVKSVRSILQCGLDAASSEDAAEQIALPLHHNVRGAEYYARR